MTDDKSGNGDTGVVYVCIPQRLSCGPIDNNHLYKNLEYY